MLIGMAGNIMKQNAISPPPKDPEMASEEESGRGARRGRACTGGLAGLLPLGAAGLAAAAALGMLLLLPGRLKGPALPGQLPGQLLCWGRRAAPPC
jgi:hypothetical protein